MLARAAKRRLKHQSPTSRHIAAAFNQLYLPWLCPAQLRWISLGPQSPPLDAIRPNHSKTSPHRDLSRSLATATDFYNSNTIDNVPFLSTAAPRAPALNTQPPPLSFLKPWTPQSPIVIHDAIATASPSVGRRLGIGGDCAELNQNLLACLAIGRLERAEAIVRRLGHLFTSDAPELINAHNMYIRNLVDSLLLGRSDVSLKKIQRWFEVDMRGKGVQADGDTYALMCRAAMISLSGYARDRTVRRYLNIAEEAGFLEETLASGEYQDAEWEELCNSRHEPLVAPKAQTESGGLSIETELEALSLPNASARMAVKAVDQKGLGLKSLTDSLTTLDNMEAVPYPHEMEGTKEEKDRAWGLLREAQLEEGIVDSSINRWKAEQANMMKMGINPKLRSRSMESLMWYWHRGLENAIKKELQEVAKVMESPAKHTGDTRLVYGPWLEAISPEKAAAIAIMVTLRYTISIGKTDLANGRTARGIYAGGKVGNLAERIGGGLENESMVIRERIRKKSMEARTEAFAQRSQKLGRHAHPEGSPASSTPRPHLEEPPSAWPLAVKIHIGALLVSKLVEIAKISVETSQSSDGSSVFTKRPAFEHKILHDKGKMYGRIVPDIKLVEMLTKEPPRYNIGLGGQLPMIVEPLPWTGFQKGGYLRYPARFMRYKGQDQIQKMYAEAAIEKGDMDQVFEGINVLSRTPWRINNNVLPVMLEAWNTGKGIADIPPESPQISYPPEPDASAPHDVKLKHKRACAAIDDEMAGLHSQRCFQNLQLEVARAFSKETFYYPHNIDFRGRAYPIPPYLNHMGADNARGLLMFAKGKPLGPTGLKWLKVHLSNVYGFDKASLSEREQFAMEHLDDVYDSASSPLNGKKWWLKAEDPWQCLACCFDLRNALDSPDPTQFVSHLAVHQDGTCNGLQHYAALGGDALGAAQVNLEPGDRPADIYTGVANLVKDAIAKDAEEGLPMAVALKDKITRKVVKQTVMTNVYGVTFVGARAQVHKQLDDIMPNLSACNVDNYHLSAYIATKIFKALAAMFTGAHDIQYWLSNCADRISTAITPEQINQLKARKEGKPLDPNIPKHQAKALMLAEKKLKTRVSKGAVAEFKSSVIWTTPLKLPVVQPYRASKTKEIFTSLQGITIREPKPDDPVSKRKQLQAFPPNFIHSLDATHMLLSALKCDEIGLTFASVHDSFWTHAGDVPVMNQVLRDAFVRMHSEDIVGRLASEFKARYKDSMRLASVYSRSVVGKRIVALRRERTAALRRMKKAERASHSAGTMADELLEEWERLQLLQSEDPELRRKGEEMVTPGSLFAEAGESSKGMDLPTIEAMEKTGLGSIPTNDTEDGLLEDKDEKIPPNVATRELKSNTRKKPQQVEGKVTVWVPLTIPAVPPKGDFDVSRLKNSTYFFS
ncbi:DNA/RNA polymerase [Tothia fuscella]|uniref:DNA-directed RNA polymerase n=1 Tax=Tothia fuscella TaxID=1048955 RepID=A0A9P4NN15_9PEZI|nr:DNA/RNA polymerase [Tothia fuscella]